MRIFKGTGRFTRISWQAPFEGDGQFCQWAVLPMQNLHHREPGFAFRPVAPSFRLSTDLGEQE